MKNIELTSVILIISVTLSVSKRKSHKHKHGHIIKHNDDVLSDNSTNLRQKEKGLILKGKLRQQFVYEAAFADTWNNVVCSPVSALLPLGKLALGASGRTHLELFQMIGISKERQLSNTFKEMIHSLKYLPGVKLDLASRLYVSDTTEIQSKFLQSSKNIFHSAVKQISFENTHHAADEINGWVSRQTNGMIPLLLTPEQISTETSLILVNAIYFQGKWKDPFAKVGIGDFNTSTGLTKVQMMSTTNFYNYASSDYLKCQIIEIPYEGMNASFIIVLPKENNGLPMLLDRLKLAPKLLNNALNNLVLTRVILSIPKFTIMTTLNLKEMYKKIGMKYIFKKKSGLTGIVTNQELAISEAIQKAVIEVHEGGTDAAAASVPQITSTSENPQPRDSSYIFCPALPSCGSSCLLLYFRIDTSKTASKRVFKIPSSKIGNASLLPLAFEMFVGNDYHTPYAVQIMPLMFYQEEIKLIVNRPFLFYIQANGEQLFAGTFMKPENK